MKIEPVTLQGRLIRLEPMSEAHVPGLCAVGLDERIWRFMLYGMIETEQDLRAWVLDLLERQEKGGDLPFTVVLQEGGKVIGATRYLDIRREHRGLEIGGTWYGIDFQRTGVNTEAKYLLLKHAFETLGAIRVQFKADARNQRSRVAIERLGAVQEGILRKHLILPDGYVRDSVMFSILDEEWPVVKARLEGFLEAGASGIEKRIPENTSRNWQGQNE